MLLFGVAIFSYIMGVFNSIMQQQLELFADIDEGDKLQKFFGLLRAFNNDIPIKEDIKAKIEAHLAYKWRNDHNSAIDDEDELQMLIELPEQVQDAIYCDFLYDNFLITFKDYFKIPRDIDAPINDMRYTNYYTWED